MTFKILYIEDSNPRSIVAELSEYDFEVIHHDPSQFELAIKEIEEQKIDLLLLDFRLSEKLAIYDAPSIAQAIRTQHNTINNRDIPIFLISSEDNISAYYKDYTSQDLFDFAISKDHLLGNVEKYTKRMKSIINGYTLISEFNTNIEKNLVQLLSAPEDVSIKLNVRIQELLNTDKFTKNTFLASDFLINHIVKPSGILIGEEILAARLGININSGSWDALKILLENYRYKGIYSDTYDRWWSAGIELWWKSISPQNPSLKRLKANQRVTIIKDALLLNELEIAKKSDLSNSEYFWTICAKKLTPLDPIDGFEDNNTVEPWEDKKYYSITGVSELPSSKVLKTIDRKRYREATE